MWIYFHFALRLIPFRTISTQYVLVLDPKFLTFLHKASIFLFVKKNGRSIALGRFNVLINVGHPPRSSISVSTVPYVNDVQILCYI
jgi:hypothetical protein